MRIIFIYSLLTTSKLHLQSLIVSQAQKQLLKGSADFFGLNHYATGWFAASDQPGADLHRLGLRVQG